MADLNDLNKPDGTSSYQSEVWQTMRAHVARLWTGDYTGMAGLVVGMRRWVNLGGGNVRLVQRQQDGSESTLFDSSLTANGAATANALALKADAAEVFAALALKADASAMASALALKQDASATAAALQGKADALGIGTSTTYGTNATHNIPVNGSKKLLLMVSYNGGNGGNTSVYGSLSWGLGGLSASRTFANGGVDYQTPFGFSVQVVLQPTGSTSLQVRMDTTRLDGAYGAPGNFFVTVIEI